MQFKPSENRIWSDLTRDGVLVWATGSAFIGAALFTGSALATMVAQKLKSQSFPLLMQALSGQFALVARLGDELWLGGDAIRSVPLFYRDNATLASDDISKLSPSGDFCSDSVAEFVLAGFVSGSKTLYADVRTVQAGECVCLKDGVAKKVQYYDLANSYENDSEDEATLKRLDKVVMGCMGRAAEVCAGRQVAIPLSGGLDSRLIAASFKRLGYDNVVCFAYGLAGNWETKKSRAMAKAMGLPWFEIPYSSEQLKRDYHSDEMRRFWHFSGQGSALPCLTEWSAIRACQGKGLVNKDAVFLSGQSGDFINGSHLKYLFDPEWQANPLDVAGAIRSKHYSLWLDLADDPQVQAGVNRRIAEQLLGSDLSNEQGAAGAYELWECRERQLKHVVQGGRVFEFFGHDWWMPLWDRELIDFFKPVSIGLKMEGYLYAKYLAAYDPYNVFQADRPLARFDRDAALAGLASKMTLRRRLKHFLNSLPGLHQLALRRCRMREHRHYYRHNPLGFPRIYSEHEYVHADPAKRHVLSLWLRDFLKAEHGIELGRLEAYFRDEG